MRIRIGLGKKIASATIPAKPANHIHGAIAAIARPPSSGSIGIRLKRLMRKPVNASASQKWLPVARPIAAGGERAAVARAGAGGATWGYWSAVGGDFSL